jgi:hypothetical protein
MMRRHEEAFHMTEAAGRRRVSLPTAARGEERG